MKIGIKLSISGVIVITTILFYEIFIQQYKYHHYKSTMGTVVESNIEKYIDIFTRGGGKGYRPNIEYIYQVDNITYRSDNIHPIKLGKTGLRWSKDITSKYPTEKRIEIYYNPSNPSQSFIVKELSFSPYNFFLVCLLILAALGFYFIYLSYKYPERCSIRPIDSGTFQIRPLSKYTLSKKYFYFVIILMIVGGCIIVHYFYYSAMFTYSAIVISFSFLLVMVSINIIVLLSMRQASICGIPVLLINQKELCIGNNVIIHIIHKYKKEIHIIKETLSLICETVIEIECKDGTKKYKSLIKTHATIGFIPLKLVH